MSTFGPFIIRYERSDSDDLFSSTSSEYWSVVDRRTEQVVASFRGRHHTNQEGVSRIGTDAVALEGCEVVARDYDGSTTRHPLPPVESLGPQEIALRNRIFAAPDDDRPREAYATFLTARGDPRGRFIRMQVALAHAEDLAVADEANRSLEENRFAWNTIDGLAGNAFGRGFVDALSINADDRDKLIWSLAQPAFACVRHFTYLSYYQNDPGIELLAAAETTIGVRHLTVRQLDSVRVEALLASPHLRLETLEVGRLDIDAKLAARLSRAIPRLLVSPT